MRSVIAGIILSICLSIILFTIYPFFALAISVCLPIYLIFRYKRWVKVKERSRFDRPRWRITFEGLVRKVFPKVDANVSQDNVPFKSGTTGEFKDGAPDPFGADIFSSLSIVGETAWIGGEIVRDPWRLMIICTKHFRIWPVDNFIRFRIFQIIYMGTPKPWMEGCPMGL